jgi:hypothetical protein
MTTYYEPPEGMRTLLTLPDSEWNLNIYAQREGRTYSVIVGVGVGGSFPQGSACLRGSVHDHARKGGSPVLRLPLYASRSGFHRLPCLCRRKG